MTQTPRTIQAVYLSLLLLQTLASSLIWGVNTLFLLDAGLNNSEAFAANAFYTLGQMIFEVPTGVVADTWGRRASYLLGTLVLSVSTLLYFAAWQLHAPFWAWAGASMFLGLGFTFFSGATEAWLVDALHHTGFRTPLDPVFARGQVVSGAAMLAGSLAGGFVAQATNLGVPYLLRAAVLAVTFVIAYFFMRDLGFTPQRGSRLLQDVQRILNTSIDLGLRAPAVRWIMLEAPFSAGASFYAFYAAQPYLLELYGDSTAYGVAGLAAALVAGAQIAGGLASPSVRRVFRRRTSAILLVVALSSVFLVAVGFTSNFLLAIVLLALWALMFAARMPVRQAYLNDSIPSSQRATVLSFDSLIGSSGGVIIQPALGRVADVWNYPASFVAGGLVQAMAIPFVLLARRQNAPADESE
jgi:MFS family permease